MISEKPHWRVVAESLLWELSRVRAEFVIKTQFNNNLKVIVYKPRFEMEQQKQVLMFPIPILGTGGRDITLYEEKVPEILNIIQQGFNKFVEYHARFDCLNSLTEEQLRSLLDENKQ